MLDKMVFSRRTTLLFAPTDFREWAYQVDTSFWAVGDYAGLATTSTSYDAYLKAPFRAYDVRFEPTAFEERDEERRLQKLSVEADQKRAPPVSNLQRAPANW